MTTTPNNGPLMLIRGGAAAALQEWKAAFARLMPELRVHDWEDPQVDAAEVRYVLVWEPEAGRLARYPNLRAIFSAAAGVEHITRDPALPAQLPIIRMASGGVARTIAEYVAFACLGLVRDWKRIVAAQNAATWDTFISERTALDTRVGILGIGHLGLAAGRMLDGLGFPVTGWARTPKNIPGIEVFVGDAGLEEFLGGCDIVVGLLPDTPATRGLLDARRLAMLPPGAAVVNAGRGTLIVMADLIAALDSDRLSGAVIDVFEQEPLPPDHAAWRHPRITVTSHIAGYSTRAERAGYVAECLTLIEAGGTPDHLYRPGRGY
jgi:glyoxylate/hydroxypyruvate reductase A